MSAEISIEWRRLFHAPDASMGPRSDERGNAHNASGGGSVPALQWGRALMSAEIHIGTYKNAGTPTLQWGRALMSAEIHQWVLGPMAGDGLQWGRALMSAEIKAIFGTSKPPECFNGAAL